MKIRNPFWAPLLGLSVLASPARAADTQLDEIIVTALRATSQQELAASSTVLDAATLQGAGVQQFADVLAEVPGLGASGGTTRPRYFQLRGVGEQEQYQGAPNPSVGFLIDDIDFSGVGAPATLFDVRQIEVLRGPQGTVYGANALAGLISVRTADPSPEPEARSEVTLGDYGTGATGLALSDGLGAGQGGWRLVAQRYRSDGFRYNARLGRDDTNGFDELTLRGKFFWTLGDALRADLSLMHVDLDNGYDAWSIDNSRTTESDQPGRDAQRSHGAALRLKFARLPFGEILSITSAADSKIRYAFDADWGNDAFWATRPGCSLAECTPYDYYTAIDRKRRSIAEDLRFIGNEDHRLAGRVRWLVGAYALRLREDNDQLDTARGYFLEDPAELHVSRFASRYAATNAALYGSLDADIGAYQATLGLRTEQRRADYEDSNGIRFAPTDRMIGGNFSLARQFDATHRGYVLLARGYKAGGFNINASLPEAQRRFEPEYLWNAELGLKHGGAGPLQFDIDVFYMWRQAMQTSISYQAVPGDPSTFGYYTANAARGENYGLEGSLGWQLASRWRLSGSLALLHTRYIGYRYIGPAGERVDLDGRAQEYAPGYKTALALEYRHPRGWFARLDATATDGFYISAGHDQALPAYQQFDARAGFEHGAWSASLWVRNLFDRDHALHGFYFGNEPPDFPNRLYLQAGDPRHFGLTVRYEFHSKEH